MRYILDNIEKARQGKTYYFPYFNKWIKEKSHVSKQDINKWLSDMNYKKSDFEFVLASLYQNETTLDPKNKVFLDDVFDLYENELPRFKTKIAEQDFLDITIFVAPFAIKLQELIQDLDLKKQNSEVIQSTFHEKMITFIIKAHILELEKFEKRIHYHYINEEHSRVQYTKFLREYLDSPQKLKKFFQKYSLMLDDINLFIQNFSNFIREIDTNLRSNDFNDYLILGLGQGDTHQKSRSVVKISNHNEVYYYKPKNLMIEQMFYSILKIYNENDEFDFLIPNDKTIYAERYSIQKEVAILTVENKKDFESYYAELGALLFIVYALNGNDMHYENIIACGKHPVLIDLETLFQATFNFYEDEIKNFIQGINYKLSTVGILHFSMDGVFKNVDLSGLTGAQQVIENQLIIKNEGTMELTFSYDSVIMDGANNIPKYQDKEPIIENYYPHIVYGFELSYKFFLDQEKRIIQLINKHENTLARTLTRATNVYARFLSYTNHPIYYTNLVRREKLFENIIAFPFKNKKICLSEVKDLINQDIPVFFHRINEKFLLNSEYENIFEVYQKTPIEYVIDKIEYLKNNQQEVMFDLTVSLYDRRAFLNKKLLKEVVESQIITYHEFASEAVTFLNKQFVFDVVGQESYVYSEMDYSFAGGKLALWLVLNIYIKYYKDKGEIKENILTTCERITDEIKSLDLDTVITSKNQDYIDSILVFYFLLYQTTKEEHVFRMVKRLNNKSSINIFTQNLFTIFSKKLNKRLASTMKVTSNNDIFFQLSNKDFITIGERKSYSFYYGITGVVLCLLLHNLDIYVSDGIQEGEKI